MIESKPCFDDIPTKLVDSVKKLGTLLRPIVVLKLKKDFEGYRLIYGPKELQATKLAGLKQINAFIIEDTAEIELIRDQLKWLLKPGLWWRSELQIDEKLIV